MIDERFLLHRLKSTSLAGIVAAIAMGAWFAYNYYALGIAKWDVFSILLLMAAVKTGAMLYYRKMD